MKKMRTLILAICAMLALGANAKTELTTVQGDHGKLDVKIQTPDDPAELAKAAKNNKKGKKAKKNDKVANAETMKKYPLLVLCHGFGGNKEGKLFDCLVDSLNKKGIAVLRFDFNGHGKSEGNFEDMTVPNEIEDAKCILRYASSLPWVSEIALGGHSQGGVVSAMTSGQLAAKPEQDIKPISALVLLAPAAVLRDDALRGNTFGKMYDPKNPPAKIEMWGGKYLGGNYIRTAVNLPIYETAMNYQGPECILHGDADRIVPYTYGLRFHYLNKQSEWHLMTDADHGFSNQEEKSAHIASEFLAKTLGSFKK